MVLMYMFMYIKSWYVGYSRDGAFVNTHECGKYTFHGAFVPLHCHGMSSLDGAKVMVYPEVGLF